jgi:hypothetical protein
MFMKNKRHVGSSTTVRVTPKLRPEAGHHHRCLTGIKGDGARVRMTGILSYPNGVAEFDALLTDDEEKELRRLLADVADRVHGLLLDDNDRRNASRTSGKRLRLVRD